MGREGKSVPPTEPPPSTSVCILADDLTGACDAAVAFSRRGLLTEVILDPTAGRQPESSSEVLVYCTATRDLAPDQAAATLRPLLDGFAAADCPHLFKKIDSVFRGNTLLEIAETLRAFPDRVAVIAPALPAQGRTCADGLLHLEDLTGYRSVPLRAQWHAAGLYPHWLGPAASAGVLHAAMQEAELHKTAKAIFCEASTDAHLTAIVHAARSLQRPILWIGSGGLAAALAAALYPDYPQPSAHPPLCGPLLVVSGTDHPVTTDQLAHLRARHPTDDPSIRHLCLVHGRTTEAVICAAILQPHPPSTLLLTGGDTALLVCRVLGIHTLTLHGEFAPGVPIATSASGPLANSTILLKSGGFGAAGLLSDLALQCSSSQEACA